MLHEEDGIGVDMETTITNVAHLNQQGGRSTIEERAGDMSTPAIGVFDPNAKKGFIILFSDTTEFGYTGLKIIESDDRTTATIQIEAPAVRQDRDDESANFKAGDTITLAYNIHIFDAENVTALFEKFFEIRKELTEGGLRTLTAVQRSAFETKWVRKLLTL